MVGAFVRETHYVLIERTTVGGTTAKRKVFKITHGGTLTTLYSFCSQCGCADGSVPYAGLVQASNGDLYGTTRQGGANGSYRTIFKITTNGPLTTLHSFDGQDSIEPWAGLIQATEMPGRS
jgi:uncharacterized repeat protein (TIGR03803 family)